MAASRQQETLIVDVKEEELLGGQLGNHWYYVSKGRALRQLLGSEPVGEILDVGAGSGVFSRQLIDQGLATGAMCVDPAYVREYVESYRETDITFTRRIEKVSQDLILMMDVLEHVDDDLGLLKEYTAGMPSGSRVLITVPAFQFMWSGHDVFLEHRRRYTLKQLENLVAEADLRITKGRYFFGLIFPLVATMRLYDRIRLGAGLITAQSQLKTASPMVNRTMTAIHDVERCSLFQLNRAFGLSAFCLAERAGKSGQS
jgi:hypothetical protein